MEMNYDEKGLVPVITQDFETKEVLMLAYANREALEKTLETGKVHYYSRSRKALWMKGETSGHFQFVKQILVDCDQDTILILVNQTGAACHTGNFSCFYRSYNGEEIVDKKIDKGILKSLYDVIVDRQKNPKAGSYTNYLFSKGIDKMLKKVGEESAEVIIAAKNREKSEIVYETADLLYHLSVVLVENKITWDEIFEELIKRR